MKPWVYQFYQEMEAEIQSLHDYVWQKKTAIQASVGEILAEEQRYSDFRDLYQGSVQTLDRTLNKLENNLREIENAHQSALIDDFGEELGDFDSDNENDDDTKEETDSLEETKEEETLFEENMFSEDETDQEPSAGKIGVQQRRLTEDLSEEWTKNLHKTFRWMYLPRTIDESNNQGVTTRAHLLSVLIGDDKYDEVDIFLRFPITENEYGLWSQRFPKDNTEDGLESTLDRFLRFRQWKLLVDLAWERAVNMKNVIPPLQKEYEEMKQRGIPVYAYIEECVHTKQDQIDSLRQRIQELRSNRRRKV